MDPGKAGWDPLTSGLSGMLHQVSYMVALPFQAAAGLPGVVSFDPAEPFIALLYLMASALLVSGAGRNW